MTEINPLLTETVQATPGPCLSHQTSPALVPVGHTSSRYTADRPVISSQTIPVAILRYRGPVGLDQGTQAHLPTVTIQARRDMPTPSPQAPTTTMGSPTLLRARPQETGNPVPAVNSSDQTRMTTPSADILLAPQITSQGLLATIQSIQAQQPMEVPEVFRPKGMVISTMQGTRIHPTSELHQEMHTIRYQYFHT